MASHKVVPRFARTKRLSGGNVALIQQWLSSLDEGTMFVLLMVLFLGASEAGLRLGRRVSLGGGQARDLQEMSTIQAAVLGLLALLLGFTFSMAASRFEARKELVRDEVNSIGTTYLRTQLLQEPYRSNTARLLRQYVDTRLELQEVGHVPQALAGVNVRTAHLQDQLWSEAVAAADRDPRSVPTGLFIQSLNDMIDMHGKQVAALRNRVPFPIFMLLCFVAVAAMAMTGYGCGLDRDRNFPLTLTMALVIASVIWLIVDLHRPSQGLITVDQQSLIELRESVRATPR
jgi:hypothetical protein